MSIEMRGEAASTEPLYDRAAIEYLSRCLDATEAGASSHWREMHADFRYADEKLSGLRGFGTYRPRSDRLRSFAHRMLQQRWRRMGRGFPDFPRIEAAAFTVARRQGRIYNLDVLRQTLTLSYLLSRIPRALAPGEIVVVIGDGYGTFSSIVLETCRGVRVVCVNLVKTLLVDMLFIARAVPGVRQALVTDAASMKSALADRTAQVVAIRADDSSLVRLAPASLAVNIASMQEMNPWTIAHYFDVLRSGPRRVAFYCCNREEKVLPDGTVVRFADYPWRAEDDVLEDELCPWHQNYYSAWPPFVHPSDGPSRHRLTRLASSAGDT